MNIATVCGLIKALAPGVDPADVEQAVNDWLDDHPEATTTVEDGSITAEKLASALSAKIGEIDDKYEKPSGGIPSTDLAESYIEEPSSEGTNGQVLTTDGNGGRTWTTVQGGGGGATIDDTAGEGDTTVVWSADKTATVTTSLSEAIAYKTPEMFGAVGDGVTDDSEAVQDAIDAGYAVRFADNKTYYLADTVTIDHSCQLIGGKNTVIKTETHSGGSAYDGIVISGTLKKTTTLTGNYKSSGTTEDNCNNRFTLSDMTDITVGDIMVIEATDQYYHYARNYYHLGATLLITDVYGGHIYTCDVMPFDIENTENVSVKIYSAPKAIIENIEFVSSGFDGNSNYLLNISYCKNSTVRNCGFSQMNKGFRAGNCVNVAVEDVALSKSKYDNSLSGDGYGIVIYSCSNTIIDRVLATCAQHAITISGQIPSISTYIRNCNLTAECRAPGLDTHESTYNLVVEDCVLGTAALNGTVHLNRCRVINNRRFSNSAMNVSVYGSHKAEWSNIVIENTVFEGTAGISIEQSALQSPVQTFDNVYGNIRFENCTGGSLNIIPVTNATILSNTIQNLTIKNWRGCKEIYVTGSWKAKKAIIENSDFAEHNFINDHNTSHGVVTSSFEQLDLINIHPMIHKCSMNRDTHGECVALPENVEITLSSANNSAKYILCGSNLVSNNIDDYVVGTVSGSAGGTLSRTPSTASGRPTISFNESGDLVYSQGSLSSSYSVYQLGAFYVKENSTVNVSAKIVNSGETTGAYFRAYFAVVDCSTGKLIDRYYGDKVQATSEGAICSRSRKVAANCIVVGYFYCDTPVVGSETTFEDLDISCTPAFAPAVIDQTYNAKRRTGNGTLTSLAGVNNIMCSELNFHVSFAADLVNNPI